MHQALPPPHSTLHSRRHSLSLKHPSLLIPILGRGEGQAAREACTDLSLCAEPEPSVLCPVETEPERRHRWTRTAG